MRVMIIGLGSMGKRRLRLLQKIEKVESIVGVDFREDRRKEVTQEHGIDVYTSIQDAVEVNEIDSVFVCTSPLSHGKIIMDCLQKGFHVFTEINLVPDYYDECIEIAKRKQKVLFLSSTPMYRKEIIHLRDLVQKRKQRLNYTYHVGQYLPDWHPWENYKDFFVGNQRTNGCREIFAIELPWMIECFGDIEKVISTHDKMTGLIVSYDDNYVVQMFHKSGNKGTFHVDIVSPYPIRNLEIYGESAYWCWDGTPNGLFEYDNNTLNNITMYDEYEHKDGYQKTIIENAYKEEILEFLEVVSGKKKARYSFEKDKRILSLIDMIEGVKWDPN